MSSETEAENVQTEQDSETEAEEHDETDNKKQETQEEGSEEQTENNSNQDNSYNPEPMIGDLFVGGLISVVLVPLWASPLTGLIALLLSSVSPIGFVPIFAVLSLASAIVSFSYLYSYYYR